MKYYAIIVAGGSGKRMQNTVAKQFLLLKGRPVIMHTLSAFYYSTLKPELIVVLHPELHAQWEALCVQYQFTIPHRLIGGGEERFHSVRSGLMSIKGDGLVAVHDAVRPLVTDRLISGAFEMAAAFGNAVSCVKPIDSVRKLKKAESKALKREHIVLVQTPQVFEISQLRKAYQQRYSNRFTDDASVVEKAGFKINLIEGERNNLKITYPEDLELAHFLLK